MKHYSADVNFGNYESASSSEDESEEIVETAPVDQQCQCVVQTVA